MFVCVCGGGGAGIGAVKAVILTGNQILIIDVWTTSFNGRGVKNKMRARGEGEKGVSLLG